MTRYIPIEEAVRVVDMCFFIQGAGDEGLKNTICKSIEKNSKAIEDAAPVIHAHWTENVDFPCYNCSNCHDAIPYAVFNDYTYCPHCGAKMDEIKND